MPCPYPLQPLVTPLPLGEGPGVRVIPLYQRTGVRLSFFYSLTCPPVRCGRNYIPGILNTVGRLEMKDEGLS